MTNSLANSYSLSPPHSPTVFYVPTAITKPAIPVSYSSFCLLLLRFSRDSVENSTKHRNGMTSSLTGTKNGTIPTGTKHSIGCSRVAPEPDLYSDDEDDDEDETALQIGAKRSGETESTSRTAWAPQHEPVGPVPAAGGSFFGFAAEPTTTSSLPGETKSKEPVKDERTRRRRVTAGSFFALSAEHSINSSIDSIAAVSNIVDMVLAPMVIVPFLDYLEHGTIPRSNTAKPGTSDGVTAKMGSRTSISQPLTKGWTVIFISVSSSVSVHL